DCRGEAGGSPADDKKGDLLAWLPLAPDPQRAQDLASRRGRQLEPAGPPEKRGVRFVAPRGMPGAGRPVGAKEIQHLHRRLRRSWADDLEPDSFDRLERLTPGDESR